MSLCRLAACTAAIAFLIPAAAHAAPVKVPKAKPTARGYGGAAATVDPYATKIAIDVLRRGGNAVDAAVAAAAALGVVEPYSAGIGGGGYMVVRSRNGKVRTIDGRETAPQDFDERSLLDPDSGEPIPFEEAVTSGLSVGVPGTVATWERALERYGTRPLRRLLEPSIRLADRGFTVDKELQQQTKENRARFADFPATASLYLPKGQPIRAGSVLRNRDLADTYRAIARSGNRALSTGPIADDIVSTVTYPPLREGATRNARSGPLTTEDLAAYRVIERNPAVGSYRGNRVYGMAPSSSGGTTVIEALGIMQALGRPAKSEATTLHRYLEASKLAYADRGRYLGDPRFVDVPVRCLLSRQFARARAKLIGRRAASAPVEAGRCGKTPTKPKSAEDEGTSTTHLSVADRFGNVVSYTLTIESTGGNGMVVPSRGFLLNNELTDFTFEPGSANSPAAGKRPRSSMAPTILTRGGRPVLALGSPGGATIITTVLQTIVNRYELRRSLPAAVAAPRLSQRNAEAVEAEPRFKRSPAYGALRRRGHKFDTAFADRPQIGRMAAVGLGRGGRMTAVAEPQRSGGGSAMVVRKRKR